MKRIAMWSGPRNISTALMRAFENRADCVVVDEPLYAHYLAETGHDHPMRAEVLASQPHDWRAVAAALIGPIPGAADLFYQKHMSHHLLPGIERNWMRGLTHAFLIRDPRAMLASYRQKRELVSLTDLGLPQQVALFDWIEAEFGVTPPVIDSRDVLQNPRGMLNALCAALDLVLSAPTAAAATAASVGTMVWFLTAGRTWPQLGTNEYPWYASTRVLSPEKFGDWNALMPDVADELEVFASGAERKPLI